HVLYCIIFLIVFGVTLYFIDKSFTVNESSLYRFLISITSSLFNFALFSCFDFTGVVKDFSMLQPLLILFFITSLPKPVYLPHSLIFILLPSNSTITPL